MAKFRLIHDESRHVSILPHGSTKRVQPEEIFTVPDKYSAAYECQPHLYELIEEPEQAQHSEDESADLEVGTEINENEED